MSASNENSVLLQIRNSCEHIPRLYERLWTRTQLCMDKAAHQAHGSVPFWLKGTPLFFMVVMLCGIAYAAMHHVSITTALLLLGLPGVLCVGSFIILMHVISKRFERARHEIRDPLAERMRLHLELIDRILELVSVYVRVRSTEAVAGSDSQSAQGQLEKLEWLASWSDAIDVYLEYVRANAPEVGTGTTVDLSEDADAEAMIDALRTPFYGTDRGPQLSES